MSYTTFQYCIAAISSELITKKDHVEISVEDKKTGEKGGEETVQLFIRDISGEVVQPVKELKGFRKTNLAPGEKNKVSFTITESQLRYYNEDLIYDQTVIEGTELNFELV
nr:fibronectin type III-like domain-contianing protein [Alteribacter keqinensis]